MNGSMHEHPLFSFLLFAVCFYSVFSYSDPPPACSSHKFGGASSPAQITDCDQAYSWVPGVSPARHLFVEPQFQSTPFSGVVDSEGIGIVQVPKIWAFGKSILLSIETRIKNLNQEIGSCRIALLSYGSEAHRVITPSLLNWVSIKRQANAVRITCISDKNVGGYAAIKGKRRLFLCVLLSASVFENRMITKP